jgi:hypothetical protein
MYKQNVKYNKELFCFFFVLVLIFMPFMTGEELCPLSRLL